ncbi:MAG: TolC family protein [Acidobacteriota bacterium]
MRIHRAFQKTNRYCCLLLLIGSFLSAYASEQTSNTLTLEACVDVALDKNPYYRAILEGIIAAGEAAQAAKAAYYPEVSFQTGYRKFETHAFLPEGLSFPGLTTVVGPIDSYSLTVNAGYTLYDSGLRNAQHQASLASKAAVEEYASRSHDEVIFAVHQSYYSLLAAQEGLSVARKNLRRSEEHLRLAETRKSVGAVPLADVLRAKVEVSNAKLSVVQAESNVRVAQGNLNASMGLPIETVLSPTPLDLKIEPFTLTDISKALDHAINSRADLKGSLKQIEARRAQVAAARSFFGPRVMAQASYGRLDSDFFPQDKDWAVGLVMQIPLFSYSRTHNLAKTRSELTQEELKHESLALSIKQEVWTNVSRMQEAWESIRMAETLRQDATESLRLANERYAAGAGTITDLLDAETNLARAELTYVQAVYNYRTAISRLRKSMGDL